MSYRVELVTDRHGWRDFLELPFAVYRDDPLWVPPLGAEERRTLDVRRNPYFRHASLRLFLCRRQGQPAARVGLVLDERHTAAGEPRTALFGLFESANDEEAAGRVMEAMLNECRAAGVAVVEGPFNPNHYSPVGIQVSAFDVAPAYFETYNPAYYPALLEGLGFTVSKRLHTRRNQRVADYVRRRYGPIDVRGNGLFTLRQVNRHDTGGELERLRRVFNDAFADNWRFLPVSQEEYAFAAKGLFSITRPDLVTFVEHEGEPVGALLCVLDVNPLLRRMRGRVGPWRYTRFVRQRRQVRDVIVYAVGIARAYRSSPAYELLVRVTCATALGCRSMFTSWISEDNQPAIGAAERIGLEPYKDFVVYRQPVSEVRHA